eukprot:3612749-Pyramimonas_sp.AAC.1
MSATPNNPSELMREKALIGKLRGLCLALNALEESDVKSAGSYYSSTNPQKIPSLYLQLGGALPLLQTRMKSNSDTESEISVDAPSPSNIRPTGRQGTNQSAGMENSGARRSTEAQTHTQKAVQQPTETKPAAPMPRRFAETRPGARKPGGVLKGGDLRDPDAEPMQLDAKKGESTFHRCEFPSRAPARPVSACITSTLGTHFCSN